MTSIGWTMPAPQSQKQEENEMTPHKHAELIKAWADGAYVQWYDESSQTWIDAHESPSFDKQKEWRIKPECDWSKKEFDE
jgi:hypothetical protein